MSNEQPEQKPPIARKATRAAALLKVMAWGEPGAGKTRFALGFPAPLVIDLERGSEWYGDDFDFLVATPTPELKAGPLVHAVLEEVLAGGYPDRKTLVIDPITDYLDALEAALIEGQRKKGIDLDALRGPKRAQFYAGLRDNTRARLDALLRVPMNVVLVARAKNVWGEGSDGKMQPLGRTYDAKDIVEYLCDVVLHLERGGAHVKKSRVAALPESLEHPSYAGLHAALYRPTESQRFALIEPIEGATPAIPTDTYDVTRDAIQRAKTEAQIKKLLGAAQADPKLAAKIEEIEGLAAKRLAELAGRADR